MAARTMQLVLHYDGSHFAGWQRQPSARTVQGDLEEALERLCSEHVRVIGAGRTDAGVHARGQAAGVKVPDRWDPVSLRRALNAVLPQQIWIARSFAMREDFHARYSATSRRYSYRIGTDDGAFSPLRRPFELPFIQPLDAAAMARCAQSLVGEHSFRAFAVRGTAPETDDHRCTVKSAIWSTVPGGLLFEVEANRFLHHMVRFLVGTMLDIGAGRRPASDFEALLAAADNREVSPPASPHALVLERVTYPDELYLSAS